MENKTIWMIVMAVVVLAVITVFVNINNNATGKATYGVACYDSGGSALI